MSENGVLVSVIIPAFNHEKFIKETISSIVAQSYNNIELLIVDDGSSDNTWSIICTQKQLCEKRFTNLFLGRQENKGTCETLNRLISKSKGKYICIIASDDLLKKKAIEKHVYFLENNPDYVLSVGNDEIIDSNSNRVGWDEKLDIVTTDKAKYKTLSEYFYLNWDLDLKSKDFGSYKSLVNSCCVTHGYLIRADAIKKVGNFKKEAPMEDWYLFSQLSKIGKFNYFDEILASYRWHDSNTVKRIEYMEEMFNKNTRYEGLLVRSLKDKKWLKIFLSEKDKIPYYFRLNLFYLIRMYFSRDEKNIEFLSYRITIKKIS